MLIYIENSVGTDYALERTYAFNLTKPIYSLEDLEVVFNEIKNEYLKTTNKDFNKEPGYFKIDMIIKER